MCMPLIQSNTNPTQFRTRKKFFFDPLVIFSGNFPAHLSVPRLHRVDVPVLDGLVVGRVVAEGQRHLAEGVQAAVGVGTGPAN